MNMFRKYKEVELIGLRDGLGLVISMGKLRKNKEVRKYLGFCFGLFDGFRCRCLIWGIMVERLFCEYFCE